MAKRKDTSNPEENNEEKKPRRSSVYPRKDGRWGADFIVEATGKKRTLYGRTAKEAQEKLDKALFVEQIKLLFQNLKRK